MKIGAIDAGCVRDRAMMTRGVGLREHAKMFNYLKRIAPQVIAVLLDQVEGVKEYALVSALVTDEIERGHAVVIAGDGFTIDDARARALRFQ